MNTVKTKKTFKVRNIKNEVAVNLAVTKNHNIIITLMTNVMRIIPILCICQGCITYRAHYRLEGNKTNLHMH